MICDCTNSGSGGGSNAPNRFTLLDDMIPAVPCETIRSYAHLPNALEKTRSDAVPFFRAFVKHWKRTSTARMERKRHRRLNKHRKEQLAIDRDKQRRQPATFIRRITTARKVFTFSNLPTLSGLAASALVAFGLLLTELLSATLLMWNSGWGLTESALVMVALVATWVIQPFVCTKMFVLSLPSVWAKRVELTLSSLGVPAGILGFWIVASTLGPMMETPEFSMMATEVAADLEETGPSKSTYIYAAMVSMWLGSYAGFYFFMNCIDTLWPVHPEPNQAYAELTHRIIQTEADISASNDIIIHAEAMLTAEDYLEQVFVNRCIDYLIEAQRELTRLREQIKLSPLEVVPSAN